MGLEIIILKKRAKVKMPSVAYFLSHVESRPKRMMMMTMTMMGHECKGRTVWRDQ
jgi:hypothetical protein